MREGSIGPGVTVNFEDYAMVTLAPGMAQVSMSCGGTGEAVLESQSFAHDLGEPIKLSVHLPVCSGCETYLGVDGGNFRQMDAPTWWKTTSGQCIKDLKVRPNQDPTSDGTPVMSSYEFLADAWADGKLHKLTLKVAAKDTGCPNMILVFGNITAAETKPAQTTIPSRTTSLLENESLELSGVITDGHGHPLKHTEVKFVYSDKTFKSTTNKEGEYSINFKGKLEDGKNGQLYVYLSYTLDGKTYFRILLYGQPSWIMKNFTVGSEADLNQDFDLTGNLTRKNNKGHPYPEFMHNIALMHHHMTEALEFYKDYLGAKVDCKLPVDVHVFAQNSGTFYSGRSSSIYIDRSDSSNSSTDRPMNREWHEFGHHVQYCTYGESWPAPDSTLRPNEENHAGFINPSTSDSFVEGFAEFGSLMIADYYNYSRPDVYASFGTFELNYKPWTDVGRDEEFAVASLLWDLYDPTGDDKIDLNAKQIWEVIGKRHEDFTSAYNGFKKKWPSMTYEIDRVFIDHGFFADRTLGNGQYDPWEPYIDIDNSSNYTLGEYYIDYAMEGNCTKLTRLLYPKQSNCSGPGMIHQSIELVGPASNYQRPDRKNAGKLPGHYVKVDSQIPYYVVDVVFPPNPELDYSVRTENDGGLVYVHVPPLEYDSRITVSAEGVKTGNHLRFSGRDFHDKLHESIANGYFVEHDFMISGTPPKPPPLPEPETVPIEDKPHWIEREDGDGFDYNEILPEVEWKSIFQKIIDFIKKVVEYVKSIVSEKTSQDNVVCNKPYIRFGRECCLDKNSNSICDSDE